MNLVRYKCNLLYFNKFALQSTENEKLFTVKYEFIGVGSNCSFTILTCKF
jgi:hypothetical protein